MSCQKSLAVWLSYIILSSFSFAGPAMPRPLKPGYTDLLHTFMHRPVQQDKRAGVPNQVHAKQQQMLAALHRHKHQDLHIMKQQQQAPQHSANSAAPPGMPAVRPSNLTDSQLLHELHARWPEGYAAICAIVKDQNRDLRYWIEYHRWIGVNKFYIFDNNSTLPALMVLWDYMQAGVVDYQYFVGKPRRKPDFADTNQFKAYHGCLLQHFKQHRWLAFIDIDEFLVLPPAQLTATPGWTAAAAVAAAAAAQGRTIAAAATAQGNAPAAAAGGLANQHPLQQPVIPPSAPAPLQYDIATPDMVTNAYTPDTVGSSSSSSGSSALQQQPNLSLFLSRYEHHAALGINWVMFGSSGLQQRPAAGPLAGYTACVPQEHWESSHVKVIANTGGILGVGPTPHEVMPRPGRSTVDVDGLPFKGPKSPHAKWHKLVIHHYVLKSREEFASKKARGSGAGNVKEWSFFDYMDGLSNSTCAWGSSISRAFFASKPRLRPPRAEGHPCSLRSKQIAAQKQLAAVEAVDAGAKAQQPAGDDGDSDASAAAETYMEQE